MASSQSCVYRQHKLDSIDYFFLKDLELGVGGKWIQEKSKEGRGLHLVKIRYRNV